MPCVLVGTNQGGVLAYTIDMPANKHRDSRSPIIMPIGESLALGSRSCQHLASSFAKECMIIIDFN